MCNSACGAEAEGAGLQGFGGISAGFSEKHLPFGVGHGLTPHPIIAIFSIRSGVTAYV
ncbi:hypothetical protein GOZ78_11300 [Agrobacterium vitis]|uniref:hypothetical protein n=1 Tax=Agrobacterium vitis TaxID=373 RepID=UPI0012E7E334|nr:hypothetical protein [Agrobacterium vitis]MUZ83898.1 hypothetical protein [Agrobacterium vitis]MVA10617.1 hypothetical protein [Agrobacterium vitis]